MAPPERVIAAVRVQTALFQTPLQFAAVCMHKNLTQGEKLSLRALVFLCIAIEPSGLPSSLLIIIGDVIEALDACGRINWAKALAEPCCGAADILHTLQLTSRPNSGVQQKFPKTKPSSSAFDLDGSRQNRTQDQTLRNDILTAKLKSPTTCHALRR